MDAFEEEEDLANELVCLLPVTALIPTNSLE